jgi:AAA15 family ATPase/GTPase
MLRSFRLANHRSFLDEQELLLMPSAPGREHDVLTVAAIYGANASGKSNLLDGLRLMSEVVRLSFRQWSSEEGVPRMPFRLSPHGRGKPSTFVVELILDAVPYTYGFSVTDDSVLEEWLYAYPEKRRRMLFERDGSEIKFGSTIAQPKPKLEVLEELTQANALFLSLAAQSNLESLMPVYRWFVTDLRFRFNVSQTSSIRRISQRTSDYLTKGEIARKKLLGLLLAADAGITDLYVEEMSDPRVSREVEHLRKLLKDMQRAPLKSSSDANLRSSEESFIQYEIDRLAQKSMVPELRFVHSGTEDPFDLADESAGTRNWLDLLPSVLDALERGRTLVVDEIDASLHPLLTAKLMRLFNDAETNRARGQLIFTTHDTTPLGSFVGQDTLKRDQVWFVEKDASGQSTLYPLSDFKPRSGENTEKRYLGGSYGAVPVLSDSEFDESVRRA